MLMVATVRNFRHGKSLKKPLNKFFDILKNIELGIARQVQNTINIHFLEGIGFQNDPIRN